MRAVKSVRVVRVCLLAAFAAIAGTVQVCVFGFGVLFLAFAFTEETTQTVVINPGTVQIETVRVLPVAPAGSKTGGSIKCFSIPKS